MLIDELKKVLPNRQAAEVENSLNVIGVYSLRDLRGKVIPRQYGTDLSGVAPAAITRLDSLVAQHGARLTRP